MKHLRGVINIPLLLGILLLSVLIPTTVKLSQREQKIGGEAADDCPLLSQMPVPPPVIKHSVICQGEVCQPPSQALEVEAKQSITVAFSTSNVSHVKVRYRQKQSDDSWGTWYGGRGPENATNSLSFSAPSQPGDYQVLVAGYDEECTWACSNQHWYTKGECGNPAPVHCPYGTDLGCDNTPFQLKVTSQGPQIKSTGTPVPIPTTQPDPTAMATINPTFFPTSVPTAFPTLTPSPTLPPMPSTPPSQRNRSCRVFLDSIETNKRGGSNQVEIRGRVQSQIDFSFNAGAISTLLYLIAENGQKIDFQPTAGYEGNPPFSEHEQNNIFYYTIAQPAYFTSSPTSNESPFRFSFPRKGSQLPFGKYYLFCDMPGGTYPHSKLCTGYPYCTVNGGSQESGFPCEYNLSGNPGNPEYGKEDKISCSDQDFVEFIIKEEDFPLTPTPTNTPSPRPTNTSTPIPSTPTPTPIHPDVGQPQSQPSPAPTDTDTQWKPCSACDTNNDGYVCLDDVETVGNCFDQPVAGDCADFDFNSDGIINLFDLVRCSGVCYNCPQSSPTPITTRTPTPTIDPIIEYSCNQSCSPNHPACTDDNRIALQRGSQCRFNDSGCSNPDLWSACWALPRAAGTPIPEIWQPCSSCDVNNDGQVCSQVDIEKVENCSGQPPQGECAGLDMNRNGDIDAVDLAYCFACYRCNTDPYNRMFDAPIPLQLNSDGTFSSEEIHVPRNHWSDECDRTTKKRCGLVEFYIKSDDMAPFFNFNPPARFTLDGTFQNLSTQADGFTNYEFYLKIPSRCYSLFGVLSTSTIDADTLNDFEFNAEVSNGDGDDFDYCTNLKKYRLIFYLHDIKGSNSADTFNFQFSGKIHGARNPLSVPSPTPTTALSQEQYGDYSQPSFWQWLTDLFSKIF